MQEKGKTLQLRCKTVGKRQSREILDETGKVQRRILSCAEIAGCLRGTVPACRDWTGTGLRVPELHYVRREESSNFYILKQQNKGNNTNIK